MVISSSSHYRADSGLSPVRNVRRLAHKKDTSLRLMLKRSVLKVLPHLQANHLAESSRRGVLPKTHFYSVLCLVTICSPSFLIIRGRTGNAEYFRVRISDIQIFIDYLCVFALGVNEMFKTISIPSASL
jgi:hypothetical protein